MATQEDKGAILIEALAEYFEVEPETIHGFVFACERTDAEQGTTLSSAWSVNTPFWHLLGYVDEARHHLERNHRAITANVANGVAPAKAVPRDRPRGRRGRKG